jgi:hypothetical protein
MAHSNVKLLGIPRFFKRTTPVDKSARNELEKPRNRMGLNFQEDGLENANE